MAFDRGFWQVQLQVYQQGIQSLQLMLSSITDPEVQAFISSTIPTLQSHLDDATAIQIGVQFE